MGGISLGKSKSKSKSQQTSTSYNQAFPQLQEAYTPQVNTGVGANSALAAMLGVGGDVAGQNAAFDNFRNNSNYNFLQQEGQKAVTSDAAAKGMLTSGATLKALQERGQQTAASYLDQYLQYLSDLSKQGTQAGSVIGGAGNYSYGQGTSTGKSSGFNFGIQRGSS